MTRVRTVGDGPLAREVATALAQAGIAQPGRNDDVALDAGPDAGLDAGVDAGLDAGLDVVVDQPVPRVVRRATLYVTGYDGAIHVGPAVLPGAAAHLLNGCLECSRRSSKLHAGLPPLSSTQPAERVAVAVARTVHEVVALCSPGVSLARSTDHIAIVGDDGRVDDVAWRPSSRCLTCGGMFRVVAVDAVPAPHEHTPCADVDPRRVLTALGAQIEVIPGDAVPGVVVAHVVAAFPRSVHARILPRPPELLASGRGADVATAETGAFFEVLERALSDAVVPVDVVVARVRDVRRQALSLDAWRCPLRAAGPRMALLDDDTELDWVWGRRLADGGRVLVPARLAFKDAGHVRGSRIVLPKKGTSGRAVSTSPARATLGALLEVIEHDAWFLSRFSRAWCRAIDLGTAGDGVRAIVQAYDAAGYDVVVRDITRVDVGVCAVEALLRSRFDPSRLFVCGRAADVDPERAIVRALREAWLVRSWERVRSGGTVRSPEDSALGPRSTRVEREAWERTSGTVGLHELARVDAVGSVDAVDDIDAVDLVNELVRRPLLQGAVAFDHPLPDVARGAGLAVVSVLVPALHDEVALPPTFISARARAGLSTDELDFGPWNL
jgi:thiazole/oxazole-forming peptide maturase SagD family component